MHIVRLNEGSKWFFFLVILMTNILFLSYWLYKMMGEVKNTLRSKMGKIYLYIFLCGNKAKFESEKKIREKEDENYILKEDFETMLETLKKLYLNGDLILNNVNIGKLLPLIIYACRENRVSLDPKKFLANVTEKNAPTDGQIKDMKRNRRRFEGRQMHFNLKNNNPNDSYNDPEQIEYFRVGTTNDELGTS